MIETERLTLRPWREEDAEIPHTNHDIISPLGDKRTEHFYKMTKEDYYAIYFD